MGVLRAGNLLDGKTKATGFYREDAERIVSEAAKLPQAPLPEEASKSEATPVERLAPVISIDDPQRPLLRPEPPLNQNLRRARRPIVDDERGERQWGVARVLAWVVLAPWYLAMIGASLSVDALFVKDLLHL